MSSKNYLVSGIGVSSFGVGRFLKHLKKISTDTIFIVKWNDVESIKEKRKQKKYIQLFSVIIIQLFKLLFFYMKTLTLRSKKIIIIHPQTIGWRLTLHLIKKNKVTWYLIDNSFFCIRSYNFRKSKGECIDCIGNVNNCSEECVPFPVKISKKTNLVILNEIFKYKDSIQFYCQNASQERLLKLHFGENVKSKVLGMNTGEVDSNISKDVVPKNLIHFKIVYHGSLVASKGIKYFIELSKYLPNCKFYIPYEKSEVENALGQTIISDNLIFIGCSWESGLKDLVVNSFITICPSLWSSCVEGAVLKSLKYSRNVAMVSTQFGFVNDLPNDIILKLDLNPKTAAEQILDSYTKKESRKIESEVWLKTYIDKTDSNLMYLMNR